MKIGDISSKEGYLAWHPDKMEGDVASTCRVGASAKRDKEGSSLRKETKKVI